MALNERMRRRLTDALGNPAKAEALYETLEALGMTEVPSIWAPDDQDETQALSEGPAGPLAAKHCAFPREVVILGAGIGGLVTAYLLQLAGCHVTVLEARCVAGGRSKTARRGDTVSEVRHEKTETQTCQFDKGLYINLGPGRLPYHHRRILNLCDYLGVELEVCVMSSEANVYRDREVFSRAQPRRRIATDTQGYISELLADAIRKDALQEELEAKGITHDEKRKALLDLLKTFGSLDADYKYQGSTRAGCKEEPSVYTLDHEWQDTLFQPVGGMDQIWKACLVAIARANAEEGTGRVEFLYDCPVTHIHLEADRVTVTCPRCEVKADYCISNIPLPLLAKKVRANFSSDFMEAVRTCEFDPTCKVGWQADRRFWEADTHQMYGGISYVNSARPSITQPWYPSNGHFGEKGTMTGCYNYGEDARQFGEMSPEERKDTAWEQGKGVHPEFEKHVPKAKGITIAWRNVPFLEGGWAHCESGNPEHCAAYTRLLMPDGVKGGCPVFSVVGDQVSRLPGWQEGVMMSAEHVVQQLLGLRKTRLGENVQLEAPDTRRLVEGR